uniref:Uncharacterized protein n=1 Tax=Knipowitschia caucasica TaxID=637954 RepID=A0AAV2M9F9_KNICA
MSLTSGERGQRAAQGTKTKVKVQKVRDKRLMGAELTAAARWRWRPKYRSIDCDVAQCPNSHLVPPDTKGPSHPSHKTQWRYGSWTQCSASCGKGSRMRYVSCRDNQGGVAEEQACAHLPKPPAREVCSVVSYALIVSGEKVCSKVWAQSESS